MTIPQRIPKRHFTAICLPAFFMACASFVHAQEKILDFGFNGSGLETASGRGAAEALILKFFDADKTPRDFHSDGGKGVSGKATDKALDLSSAPTMGQKENSSGGPIAISPRTSVLDGLTSFTIQGWFKGEGQSLQGLARLLSYRPAAGGEPAGFGVFGSLAPGSINFQGLGSQESGERFRSQAAFNQANEWMFFAITYAPPTMTFYAGSIGDPVKVCGVVRDVRLDAIPPAGEISVGNIKYGMRPFKGWIDNVRVFGSRTDDAGALPLEKLEALRAGDVKGE